MFLRVRAVCFTIKACNPFNWYCVRELNPSHRFEGPRISPEIQRSVDYFLSHKTYYAMMVPPYGIEPSPRALQAHVRTSYTTAAKLLQIVKERDT